MGQIKGYKQSLEHIARRTQPRIGKKYKPYSDETMQRLKGKGKGVKRSPFSIEHRIKIADAQRGEKSHCWKGGKVRAKEVIRQSIEFRLWREAVFARDNYTCQFCGQRGGKIQADHIKMFAYHPELRFAIDNGRTLCIPCHKTTATYQKNRHICCDF